MGCAIIWVVASAELINDVAFWLRPFVRNGLQKRGFATELAKIKAALPRGTPIEVWFQDEARIGQKNKITRRWAGRGTRPSAPKDQRTKSAYIFGAICPELGKGAGLVQPFCNNQTMSLAEISLAIEPGAHGVLLMDQAGWHMTGKLEVSENIGIVPCRQNALNSTRSKISGSSCAITGCPTGSSPPTATLSTFAARPGTGWSINPGAS